MIHEERTVDTLPPCFYCKKLKLEMPARFDARTKDGPWRMMYCGHFFEHGMGVGFNYGHRLWLTGERHVAGEVPRDELPQPGPRPRDLEDRCVCVHLGEPCVACFQRKRATGGRTIQKQQLGRSFGIYLFRIY